MEFRDAQRIAVLMNDKGFSAVASESVIQKEDHYAYPDGYHVKLFMNSKVYELREADEKS